MKEKQTEADTASTQPMTSFTVSSSIYLSFFAFHCKLYETTMIERNEEKCGGCMRVPVVGRLSPFYAGTTAKQTHSVCLTASCNVCVCVRNETRIKMVLICVSFAVKYFTAKQKPRERKLFFPFCRSEKNKLRD